MINLDHLGVHFAQGFLFKDVTLQINRGDKLGLVGKNGAGKSTLLRLLSGQTNPTEGRIHREKDINVGLLTQDIKIDSESSVFDFLFKSNPKLNFINERLDQINHDLTVRTDYESESYLALLDELTELNHQFVILEGTTWEEKIVSVLKGLGFSDEELKNPINSFSGGWKMRAELARILVNQPDLLLLDEPTNHLDIISISWLEKYLQKFEGAIITISHDRLFLDNVTKRTVEISQGKMLDYPYPYSKYKLFREEELERLNSMKKQQDKDIKQTEELINKFRAKSSKAAFAQSLIKKLEKTDRIEVDNDNVAKMRISFPVNVQPGKVIMELADLGKKYGDKLIFRDINITVGRGEKIALLGPNGVGKSTMLKLVMKKIEGDGVVNYGHNVKIIYFAQDQAEQLDETKTIWETVDDIAVGDQRKDLRSILGSFLFTGEDIDKRVGVLSGGEKTRLALCRLLLSPGNFLILDEPTNHLDIQSKEVLKQALIRYEGTFIVVSHDREFLDGLTNRIWDIENYTLKIHHEGVKAYLSQKMFDKEHIAPKPPVNQAKLEEKKVPTEPKPNVQQLKNKIKKCEEAIESLEAKISEYNVTLSELDYTDEAKSNRILYEFELIKDELDQKMSEWEELTLELED